MKQLPLVSFPQGAQSDGFIAALASAALPCLGITAETPYWCNPKNSYCLHCSDCDTLSNHQGMLYHALLAASGLAFAFDYPEDDSVPYHTLPGVAPGWRWEEPFVAEVMDFLGLSYARYRESTAAGMYETVRRAIDAGYPALCADDEGWTDDTAWSRCWSAACGYGPDGLSILHHGGEMTVEADRKYSDWIVITGRTPRRQTLRDVLRRIYAVLTDPSHDALEAEIARELSAVTPENAWPLACKMMGINGVPIEARWHAAEAFCSRDSLLSSLSGDEAVRRALGSLLFARYIADGSDETHGVGWKIWGALNVGPHTGYAPTEESAALIQRPEVAAELGRLFKIVFDNDRAVADGVRAALDALSQ